MLCVPQRHCLLQGVALQDHHLPCCTAQHNKGSIPGHCHLQYRLLRWQLPGHQAALGHQVPAQQPLRGQQLLPLLLACLCLAAAGAATAGARARCAAGRVREQQQLWPQGVRQHMGQAAVGGLHQKLAASRVVGVWCVEAVCVYGQDLATARGHHEVWRRQTAQHKGRTHTQHELIAR